MSEGPFDYSYLAHSWMVRIERPITREEALNGMVGKTLCKMVMIDEMDDEATVRAYCAAKHPEFTVEAIYNRAELAAKRMADMIEYIFRD